MNMNKILEKVGLSVFCDRKSTNNNGFINGFDSYVTDEYLNSERKEMDEIYRMFEFNLLHRSTGLRFKILGCEDYFGEEISYRLKEIFVLINENEYNVIDVDFENKKIFNSDFEIDFQTEI